MPEQNEAGALLVGVDVGGTFTDTFTIDTQDKRVYLNKVSSTPSDPSNAFMNGLKKTDQPFEKIKAIIHGTTHGINTMIQRKGVRTGLLTTKGFRDLLEIRRGSRPRGHQFNLQWTKQAPFVPRYLRLGISERVDAEGNILCQLQEEEIIRAVRFLVGHGVSSVAICFLFSYLNPIHEKKAKELIKQNFPQLYVSISSDILPEWREYERTCAAVVNAYIGPIMDKYISYLQDKLKNNRYQRRLFIMNSNGGMVTSDVIREQSVQTLLSGPVAGVVAAKFMGERAGFHNLISMDMGGTSLDTSVVRKGEFSYTTESEIEEGVPIKIPTVDIRTIGAGGGSIAWIDSGGVLKVGPQSAGANPGPACYGKGGKEPTITDANLVLGRLNPTYFLGGTQKLRKKPAKEAIQKRIAQPLGISWVKAAQGIIKLCVVNMAQAIRTITTEKGIDPREFVLVTFGGAGPLHAVLIAKELGISHVVVPPYPGLASAIGLLLSDLKFDTVRSLFCQIEKDGTSLINQFLSEMLEQGINSLRAEGYKEKPVCLTSLDIRYAGQNYEINIPVDRDNLSIEDIAKRFDERHRSLYGFDLAEMFHEVLRVRVSVIGQVFDKNEILNSLSMNEGNEKILSQSVEIREVYEDSDQPKDYTIYKRSSVGKRVRIKGPAIIEEMNSTVYIPSWFQATIDSFGNIIISINKV